MVFQNYALFPHMTVGENLAFPLSVRGVNRHHAGLRIKRALEMVRMPGYQGRFPNQLSGGQQQRIAVARALVFEPQLVLMDEPLGALDKQLREEMQFELRSLHETLEITTIYVTHDQSEAMTMSDRVAVFHHGRIQQIDDPQTLYERPANLFVASSVGESNRLQAQLVGTESDDIVLLEIAGGARLRGRLAGDPSGVTTEMARRATVSVRPERVTVTETRAGGGSDPGDNCLSAHVEERIFLGTHLRVRLTTAAGELIASVPAPLAGGVPKEGADAVVRWAAASTVVFPA
jgi:putative spermidine/putrescine transport system ATP-binding protein